MQRQRQACARLGACGQVGRAKEGRRTSWVEIRISYQECLPLPSGFRPSSPYASDTKLPWNPNGILTGRWIVATGGALKSWASITITSLVFVLAS